jgi:hypothetical protein
VAATAGYTCTTTIDHGSLLVKLRRWSGESDLFRIYEAEVRGMQDDPGGLPFLVRAQVGFAVRRIRRAEGNEEMPPTYPQLRAKKAKEEDRQAREPAFQWYGVGRSESVYVYPEDSVVKDVHTTAFGLLIFKKDGGFEHHWDGRWGRNVSVFPSAPGAWTVTVWRGRFPSDDRGQTSICGLPTAHEALNAACTRFRLPVPALRLNEDRPTIIGKKTGGVVLDEMGEFPHSDAEAAELMALAIDPPLTMKVGINIPPRKFTDAEARSMAEAFNGFSAILHGGDVAKKYTTATAAKIEADNWRDYTIAVDKSALTSRGGMAFYKNDRS